MASCMAERISSGFVTTKASFLELVSDACNGTFQIVGDVGGGLVDILYQGLQLAQCAVDLCGQLIDVIARTRQRNARRDLAARDCSQRLCENIDAPLSGGRQHYAHNPDDDAGADDAISQDANKVRSHLPDLTIAEANQKLPVRQRSPLRKKDITGALPFHREGNLATIDPTPTRERRRGAYIAGEVRAGVVDQCENEVRLAHRIGLLLNDADDIREIVGIIEGCDGRKCLLDAPVHVTFETGVDTHIEHGKQR